MIITCPSCGARYKVRDDLIPESGKRVKCKKCSALFRAFPGKKAILEKAAPKPEKAPAPVSAQATVMVDQAKLSNFLQQNVDSPTAASSPENNEPPPAEPTKPSHATVQIDRTKIDQFLQHKVDNAGGDYEPNTTLEVSREELDTFLTKPGAEKKVAAAVAAAAQASAAETDASGPADSEPAEPAEPYNPRVDPDKYADLQRAVGVDIPDPAASKLTVEMPPQIALSKQDRPVFEEVHQNIAGKAENAQDLASDLEAARDQLDLTVPDRFDLPKEQEATPSFDDSSDDLLWNQPKETPTFPSDEELGLVAEPEGDLENVEAPDQVSFDDDDDFLSSEKAPSDGDDFLSTDAGPADDDDFLSAEASSASDDDFLSSDPATADDDFLTPGSDAPEAEIFSDDAVAASQDEDDLEDISGFGETPLPADPVALFNVKVENTEYPNKSLDALDRWINEGRLLETDMVAPAGSDQFKKAYDIPEIAAIFNRYFGQNTPSVESEPAAKKGFFAKLFSIFGKK